VKGALLTVGSITPSGVMLCGAAGDVPAKNIDKAQQNTTDGETCLTVI
jgi:hypothetical protein